VAGIYGLFLTQMNGVNPYTSLISNYFGIMDSADIYTALPSRLDFSTAGKIQATMNHPMTWTLVLCLSAVVFGSFYLKSKKKIYLLLLVLVGFNILVSGVRTGIAALTIGFIYFLLKRRNFKLIVLTILVISLFAIAVQTNEDLSNLFSSFVDISGQKSDIQGSSITMRIDQLEGALKEIEGCELVGRGYSWHGYYLNIHDSHPILLDFESLIFIVLCDSGIIGIIIWIIFILLLLRLQRKMLKNKTEILLLDSLVIVYVSYSIGTGEYGYMPFFAIFYTVILSYLSNYGYINKVSTQIKNNYLATKY
jgi:hypothetical protein